MGNTNVIVTEKQITGFEMDVNDNLNSKFKKIKVNVHIFTVHFHGFHRPHPPIHLDNATVQRPRITVPPV